MFPQIVFLSQTIFLRIAPKLHKLFFRLFYKDNHSLEKTSNWKNVFFNRTFGKIENMFNRDKSTENRG